MAHHVANTDKLGASVYSCDSRSPWQRGTNENTKRTAPHFLPRPLSCRLIRRTASAKELVCVVTLTRTCSAVDKMLGIRPVGRDVVSVRLALRPPCIMTLPMINDPEPQRRTPNGRQS